MSVLDDLMREAREQNIDGVDGIIVNKYIALHESNNILLTVCIAARQHLLAIMPDEAHSPLARQMQKMVGELSSAIAKVS